MIQFFSKVLDALNARARQQAPSDTEVPAYAESVAVADALIDNRPEDQTKWDYRHEEIAAAGAPSKSIFRIVSEASELPFYERREQSSSSSCMGQAYAKMRGILTKKKAGKYVSLSGGFPYRRRVNRPGEGMFLYDTLDLGKKHGLPFEAIDQSQGLGEAALNAVQEIPYVDEVAKIFTDENEKYVYLPHDFDAIAAVIAQGYPVLLMHYAMKDEYQIQPKILKAGLTPAGATIRHGVCAHDTFRYKGEDYLLMDESWGSINAKANDAFERDLKERGQRMLSREWVNARVYGAAYIKDLEFSWEPSVEPDQVDPARPRYTFTKPLRFLPWDASRNQPSEPATHEAQRQDVVELQEILKYEGFFPKNVDSTGYYGSITASAVKKWGIAHQVADLTVLEDLRGEHFGAKHAAVANTIYGA